MIILFFLNVIILRNKYMKKKSKSIKKQASERSKLDCQLKLPRGLPNVGNTCFLNSVLQQLYMINPIRKMINSRWIKPFHSQPGIMCLKKLFVIMEATSNKCLFSQMRKICLDIANFYMNRNNNYQLNDPYDSFETLAFFLNYLFEKDSNISNEFCMEYVSSCQCSTRQLVSTSFYIQEGDYTCQSCKQKIKRKFTSFPNYLIVKYNKNPAKQFMIIENCFYRLMSINVYEGEGLSGHYFTLGRYQNQFYIFNDSLVNETPSNSWKNYKASFAIFIKSKLRQRKPFLSKNEKAKQEKRRIPKFCKLFLWIILSLFLVLGVIYFIWK